MGHKASVPSPNRKPAPPPPPPNPPPPDANKVVFESIKNENDKMQWIHETCKDCLFMVDDFCRKNPPNIQCASITTESDEKILVAYPRVKIDTEIFCDACSGFTTGGE
jgi:hypothetical protein